MTEANPLGLASVFLSMDDSVAVSPQYSMRFQDKLLTWSRDNPRPMPWKESSDPYLIWLSEIILQQTRVQQGWDYFLRFKAAFPSVHDLAAADEGRVLKLWQGLGYYSRARNLHHTSKVVSNELQGQFPDNPKELQQLKGIGPYTSAAIASFAYDYPAAIVDGNVYRVLSRLFGLATPIDSSQGKKQFQVLADQLLAKRRSAKYNQALLDFGALHCKPQNPLCPSCPFQSECVAYANEAISDFPVKAPRVVRKERFFNYIVLEQDGHLLLRHRTEKDIWRGLYDFPAWESDRLHDPEDLRQHFRQAGLLRSRDRGHLGKAAKQLLTHQKIVVQFFTVKRPKIKASIPENCLWVPLDQIKSHAFPRIIDLFLADRHLYLNLQ